jgi:hypothetical protein
MATDAWHTVKDKVAKLLGRGDHLAEQSMRDTMDEDAATVAANPTDPELARNLGVQWTARLRDLLRADPQAADALRDLIADTQRHVTAGGHGVAVGGNLHIQAGDGGIAAGAIHGSVHLSNPSQPGTGQA